MGIKRVVSTDFWNDTKVSDKFTPEDKYFLLYLLTNPHTTQLGIYELSIKQAATELGYSMGTIITLLNRFDTFYNILKYNEETGEIAIKNYLRHSICKGGKPVLDCLNKELRRVKDKSLFQYVCDNLKIHRDTLNDTVKDFVDMNTENNSYADNDNYVDEIQTIAEPNRYDFDFEETWNRTFDLYPKKSAMLMARQEWLKKLEPVIPSNRGEIALLMFDGLKIYLEEYNERNKKLTDRERIQYLPKLEKWIREDSDYYIMQAERVANGQNDKIEANNVDAWQ